MATEILRKVEDEGGKMMRYTESGRSKMRIEEYAAKKHERIDLGRDVVVGINKYWIDEDGGDNRGGNR